MFRVLRNLMLMCNLHLNSPNESMLLIENKCLTFKKLENSPIQ